MFHQNFRNQFATIGEGLGRGAGGAQTWGADAAPPAASDLSLHVRERESAEPLGGQKGGRGAEGGRTCPGAGSRGPSPLRTRMRLRAANLYILAPVRVKVVALSIETLRWRALGGCY